MLSVLWFHAAGLTETLHSYFHFFMELDFRSLLTSNTESCGEDDGEVSGGVVEEELEDFPGTTNGTSFTLNQFSCHFW